MYVTFENKAFCVVFLHWEDGGEVFLHVNYKKEYYNYALNVITFKSFMYGCIFLTKGVTSKIVILSNEAKGVLIASYSAIGEDYYFNN